MTPDPIPYLFFFGVGTFFVSDGSVDGKSEMELQILYPADSPGGVTHHLISFSSI